MKELEEFLREHGDRISAVQTRVDLHGHLRFTLRDGSYSVSFVIVEGRLIHAT